jgi:two-component system response regulator FixJ
MHLVPTIYLVDDDPVVLDLLSAELIDAGMAVQAFGSAEAFLDVHTIGMRGCLLVDVRLPGMDGMDLIAALNARASHLSFVAMSGFARTPLVVQAMRAGALDFLEKPFAPCALVGAVHVAIRWASTGAADMRGDAAEAAARVVRLTPRERTVFNEFATGASTKQVAAILGVSPKTVETYRARLLSKLDVDTPYALVRLAVLASLFGPVQRDRAPDLPR